MKNINSQIDAARLAKLNHMVTLNSTLSPYMLFPVRLETHFREATVSSRPEHEKEIEDILTSFANITNRLNTTFLVKNEGVISTYSDSLPEELYDLRVLIEELDLVSSEHKGVIQDLALRLHNIMPNFGDSKLDTYSKDIVEAAKTIEVSTALKENRATVFINELRANYKSLKTLAEYTYTPYRSTKYYQNKDKVNAENKRLYRYVSGRVMTIKDFFSTAENQLKDIPSLDNRQRHVAVFELFAKKYSEWELLFNKIETNFKNIYKKFDFQREKLNQRYHEDWLSILLETKTKAKNFTTNFDKNIENKPRTVAHYTRVVQSALQMQIDLLHASIIQKYIPYTELKAKISGLNSSLEKTIFNSRTEKDLTLGISAQLNVDLSAYYTLMVSRNFVDYQATISSQNNDMFLNSVQLQTVIAKTEIFKTQKQLCVRIFPDDIFIHQHEKLLSKEELTEGKRFWIKYFIASENESHEREAWSSFWRKFEVMRASWIARTLRPEELSKFSDRQPFKNSGVLEKLLDELVEISNNYNIDESKSQTCNESKVIEMVQVFLPKFYEVRKIVMQYSKIVDYLFQKINGDLSYVKRRLETFIFFYNKNLEYKKRADMAYTDLDFQSLSAFYDELNDLLAHIEDHEVSLEVMVDEYLERLDFKEVFFKQNIKTRDGDAFTPPLSAILPNRFLFFGDTMLNINGKKRNKRIVHAGRKVKKGLKLSIDFGEDNNINPYHLDVETGEIDIRGGIRWMTDYEIAVKSGMAITIPLPHSDSEYEKAKFSVIYVLGVKDKVSDDMLEDFYNGHIYGQSGLDFLKIGTPTNSFDDIVSGYNSDESLLEQKRFEIDVKENFKGANSKQLFDSLSNTIGIDINKFNTTLGRVNSYDNNEIQKAKTTNAMMCEELSDAFKIAKDGSVEKCKTGLFLKKIPEFVTNYTFARGIIPPLRIGNQPYGILPTTAYSKFELESASDDIINYSNPSFLKFARELYYLLKRLTNIWNGLKRDHVIHSENLKKGNPQKRYLEMMNLTPTSVSFFERTLIEALPILHPAINYMPIENTQNAVAKILKDMFDITFETNKNSARVLDELPLFRSHAIDGMLEEFFDKEANEPTLKPFIEEILYGIGTESTTKDNKEKLLTIMEEDEIPLLVAEFMDLFTYRLDAWWSGLVNFQLERIRKGEFGKASFATSIGAYGWLFNLNRNINKSKKELPKAQADKIVQEMNLRDQKSPIFQDEEHNEFILAPSINQAITAAILRSAYKKSKIEDGDSRLCINLSSLRVRKALRLIDGVRNGLSVGAVLGADLERGLHEAYKTSGQELDRYIYPLRQLFPLKMEIKSESEGPEANSYIMSVINGELLLNKINQDNEDNEASDFRSRSLSNYLLASNPDAEPVKWFHDLFKGRPSAHKLIAARQIEQLADTFDALSDLVLSEGVYQLVQGNRVAFSALMQNMQDGRIFNLPQITEIPIHSAVVRHKVAIALDARSDIEALGWDRNISSENAQNETVIGINPWVLSKVEPALSNWIGKNLGSATDIRFVIEQTDDDDKITESYCSISELGISPLTYFYLSSNISLFVRYIELSYRKKHRLFSQKLLIDYKKRKNTWGAEIKTIFENEWVLNNLRSLLANSRALTAEDFSTTVTHGGEINLKGIDKAELKNKFQLLLDYCKNLSTDLQHLIEARSKSESESANMQLWTEAEVIEVVDKLVESASLGISTALTSISSNTFESKTEEQQLKMQKSLLATCRIVFNTISSNIKKAGTAITEIDNNDEESVLATYTKAIQELLYASFRVIPHFNLKPLSVEDFAALSEQLKADFSYQNVSPLEMESWTSEVSKVRAPMAQFNQIRIFSDFSGIPQGQAAVLQFPFNAEKDKEWLGREVVSEDAMDDKESLVIYDRENFTSDATTFNAGLIIDNWMEFLPYEKQRGGIVFNFDQPNAEAPQVILLAVPSKIVMRKRKDQSIEAKNWTLDDLIVTLNDTRLMAENRAVEPDHLYAEPELAKVIPLLKYRKVKI